MSWVVVCAHCGKPMSINALVLHCKNRHNWKTLSGGGVDTRSNPFWNAGGI